MQIVYPTEYGVDLAAAYCRIETVAIELPPVDESFMTVRVAIYANAAAKDSGKKIVANIQVDSTHAQYLTWVNACRAGVNPLVPIYNFLKTVPPFIGGTDV